jgi:hypothetical protein
MFRSTQFKHIYDSSIDLCSWPRGDLAVYVWAATSHAHDASESLGFAGRSLLGNGHGR